MGSAWRLATCLGALLCMGCTSAPTIGQQGRMVTGGAVDTGHPAVVRLRYEGPGIAPTMICTGTLIGKRTVLTAAHCTNWGATPASLSVEFENGETAAVADLYYYPGYIRPPACTLDIPPNTWEAVVLRLASTPSITPAAIATEAIAPDLPITLVGYGHVDCRFLDPGEPIPDDPNVTCTLTECDGSTSTYCCQDDMGIKREGETVIDTLTTAGFQYVDTPSICVGDSGGPTFAQIDGQERQIGVHSMTILPCGTWALDVRVDVLADWIQDVTNGDVNLGADQTPPEPSFVGITDGATLEGASQRIEITVTDDADPSPEVTLLVDGEVVASKIAAPYVFQVSLAPGQHEVEALARDAAGRDSSTTVTVDVANVSPSAGADASTIEDATIASDRGDAGAGSTPTEDAPPGDGCAVAGRAGATPVGWLLFAYLLSAFRRRRRQPVPRR